MKKNLNVQPQIIAMIIFIAGAVAILLVTLLSEMTKEQAKNSLLVMTAFAIIGIGILCQKSRK